VEKKREKNFSAPDTRKKKKRRKKKKKKKKNPKKKMRHPKAEREEKTELGSFISTAQKREKRDRSSIWAHIGRRLLASSRRKKEGGESFASSEEKGRGTGPSSGNQNQRGRRQWERKGGKKRRGVGLGRRKGGMTPTFTFGGKKPKVLPSVEKEKAPSGAKNEPEKKREREKHARLIGGEKGKGRGQLPPSGVGKKKKRN